MKPIGIAVFIALLLYASVLAQVDTDNTNATIPPTDTAGPVYLPMISNDVPTATDTPTNTSTPTKTPVPPTATRTPTKTPTPTAPTPRRPVLEDGEYLAEFNGGEAGWIYFRVSGNGTRAFSGRFLVNNQHPLCNPAGYAFYDTVPITDGTFQFFADAASLNSIAEMNCVSVSSTRASCAVIRFRSSGPFPFCNSASSIVSRR